MSLRLRRHESVRDAIRRIGAKRIASAAQLIHGASQEGAGERIHQARKQLKRARALLRLVRPEVADECWSRVDRRLRKVARAVSAARDATVLIDTLRKLQERQALTSDSLTNLLSSVQRQQARVHADVLANHKDRRRLERALYEAARRVTRWTQLHRGWKAIVPGLRRIYAEAQAAAASLQHIPDCDDMTLHKARKRAQTLLHVLEFLRPVRPTYIGARIRALHDLADLLGKDHDLAVLEGTLRDAAAVRLTQAALQRLNRAVSAERRGLQHRASQLAEAVYAETEDAFVSQIHRRWKTWRGHRTRASEAVR